MKLSSFFCQCLFLLLALFCLAGCISFEYTGREYAPLAEGKDPAFFTNRKKMPAGLYTIIGRATITVPGNTDAEDVKLRLLDEAAARGADAVCIVSQQKVRRNLYSSQTQFSGPEAYSTNPYNLTPDGARIQVNIDGETVDLHKKDHGAMKVIFKALFFKNKEELEKINAQREKQLEKIINRPAGQY